MFLLVVRLYVRDATGAFLIEMVAIHLPKPACISDKAWGETKPASLMNPVSPQSFQPVGDRGRGRWCLSRLVRPGTSFASLPNGA